MADMDRLAKQTGLNNKMMAKSMAQKNEEITSHIKSYLSKADKFSVRMSAAMQIRKKPKYYVDNINMSNEQS